MPPYREEAEVTMYDDDEELDEDEGQVTGLMHAAAINDEEYLDADNPNG